MQGIINFQPKKRSRQVSFKRKKKGFRPESLFSVSAVSGILYSPSAIRLNWPSEGLASRAKGGERHSRGRKTQKYHNNTRTPQQDSNFYRLEWQNRISCWTMIRFRVLAIYLWCLVFYVSPAGIQRQFVRELGERTTERWMRRMQYAVRPEMRGRKRIAGNFLFFFFPFGRIHNYLFIDHHISSFLEFVF